jgi:hypothetical protein
MNVQFPIAGGTRGGTCYQGENLPLASVHNIVCVHMYTVCHLCVHMRRNLCVRSLLVADIDSSIRLLDCGSGRPGSLALKACSALSLLEARQGRLVQRSPRLVAARLPSLKAQAGALLHLSCLSQDDAISFTCCPSVIRFRLSDLPPVRNSSFALSCCTTRHPAPW